MLEYLNSVACAILLACMMPVASMVSLSKHPLHALLVLWVAVAFALQVVSPFEPQWLPTVAWQTGFLHLAQAAAVLIWRKRLLLFLRAEFEEIHLEHPLRRTSDFAPLELGDMNQVHGRGP